MSSHVWKMIQETIRVRNRSIPKQGRRPEFPDTLIVGMYLWSVAHDRPLCWAADRTNYNSVYRPRRLPSRSQFCRRIKSPRCQELLLAVHEWLSGARRDNASALWFMDGRVFRVGPHTTDPEAHAGFGGGAYGKGYRLHALTTSDGRFTHFRVTAMNVNEKVVARKLLADAKPPGIVLADGGYESGPLSDYAMERGTLMITPLKKNAGQGHHTQSRARMLIKQLWEIGIESLYRRRQAIERFLGQLSSFGGGLAPLPAWVRRLDRVQRWITAKIVIYHARMNARLAGK